MNAFLYFLIIFLNLHYAIASDKVEELRCQLSYFELYFKLSNFTSSDYIGIICNIRSDNDTSQGSKNFFHSELRRIGKYLVLRAPYNHCSGIVSVEYSYGIYYNIQIRSIFHNVTDVIKIGCFVPSANINTENLPVRLVFNTVNRSVKDVRKFDVDIGSELKIQTELNTDLYSFPVDIGGYPFVCSSLQLNGRGRTELIADGCPSLSSLAGRKVTIVQNTSSLHSTLIKLLIDEDILPWKSNELNSEYFYIQCKIIPCTGNHLQGFFGLSKCPRTTHLCFGRTTDEFQPVSELTESTSKFPVYSSPLIRMIGDARHKGAPHICEKCLQDTVNAYNYFNSRHSSIPMLVLCTFVGILIGTAAWFLNSYLKRRFESRKGLTSLKSKFDNGARAGCVLNMKNQLNCRSKNKEPKQMEKVYKENHLRKSSIPFMNPETINNTESFPLNSPLTQNESL